MLFSLSNLTISLHLNPFGKSNPILFFSLKYFLKLDFLFGWLVSQVHRWANIDQRKNYSKSFSIFNKDGDLNGVFI